MSKANNPTTDVQNSSPTLRSRIRSAIGSVADRIRDRGGETAQTQPDPDRRAFLRKTGAAGVAVAAGTAASSGQASALGDECSVGRTDDQNLPFSTDGTYGGWGGANYWGTSSGADKTPVVFVHGNLGEACNWDDIANHLKDQGWTGDELWSITFGETTTDHDEMPKQLHKFVNNVKSETGKSEVHVVAHSLGVTGVRKWMQDYDTHSTVDTFIGMAGANHGVCVCPGCYDVTLGGDYSGIMGAGEACQFFAAQCFGVPGHPLYDLNLPDETPGDSVTYKTTRGLYDSLYMCNIFSPYLDGAENDYFYTNHMGQLDQDDEVEERLPDEGGTGGDGGDDDSGWYGWW